MATQDLAPDAILEEANYQTLNLTDIDEDPDSNDGNWGIWDNSGGTIVRCSFPTPSSSLNTGADLQVFRARVRKTSTGGNDPVITFQLFENGSLKNGTQYTLVDADVDPGRIITHTWDAADLGTADGSLVEIKVHQTSGGAGAGKRACEVGALQWRADVSGAAIKDVIVVPGMVVYPR